MSTTYDATSTAASLALLTPLGPPTVSFDPKNVVYAWSVCALGTTFTASDPDPNAAMAKLQATVASFLTTRAASLAVGS